MKILNYTLTLILSMGLMSCAIGPTAKLADGTLVTLGGDFATKSVSDARTAVLPNGTKLGWARNGHDYTGVLNNALTIGIPAVQLSKAIQSNNAVKIANGANATKVTLGAQKAAVDTARINATSGVQNQVVGKATETTVAPLVVSPIK